MNWRKTVLVLAVLSAAGLATAIAKRAWQEPAQITAYGDSTQVELGDPHASSRKRWRITNKAVAGSTSSQLLSGTDGRNLPWAEEMATSNASGVIVNHGLNDDALTIDEYRSNLTQLATQALLSGKWVILEQPNHMAPGEQGARHEARIQAMREVAESLQVKFCDQPSVPLHDSLHPTDHGYFLKSKRLAQCIREVM